MLFAERALRQQSPHAKLKTLILPVSAESADYDSNNGTDRRKGVIIRRRFRVAAFDIDIGWPDSLPK